MSVELRMPAFSSTMEKGLLVAWMVGEGDFIVPGDILAVVENEKATMELEADVRGEVAKLTVSAGAIVRAGSVIALLRPIALQDPMSEGSRQRSIGQGACDQTGTICHLF